MIPEPLIIDEQIFEEPKIVEIPQEVEPIDISAPVYEEPVIPVADVVAPILDEEVIGGDDLSLALEGDLDAEIEVADAEGDIEAEEGDAEVEGAEEEEESGPAPPVPPPSFGGMSLKDQL